MGYIVTANATSGIGSYVRDELYLNFSNDRYSLEQKWQKNLDAYNAVSSGAWKKGEAEDWRSDTFFEISRVRIISAWSILIDMILQGGEVPFALLPSAEDEIAMESMDDLMRDQFRKDIEDMERHIQQQLSNCKADRQLMKCILSGAIYGEAYAKHYVYESSRTRYKQISFAPLGMPDPAGMFTRWNKFIEDIKGPAFQYWSVWDVFRDLETDDLQDGMGVIFRQLTSPYALRKKIGKPLYIEENILGAISQAAQPGSSQYGGTMSTTTLLPGLRDIKHRYRPIEELEFWGRVPRVLVEEFERQIGAGNEDYHGEGQDFGLWDGDEIECLVHMADNQVIRFARVEPGKRPVSRMVWETKLDHPEGTGIADNLEDVQFTLNGLLRSFEDNKKLSGNVILGVKERYLSSSIGSITPGMKIDIAEECDDVRKAIQQIQISDIGESLINAIRLFMELGDQASLMPQILQGNVNEKTKPDTAYEIYKLSDNSTKYLAGVIKNIDEGLIEPIIQWCYEYAMDDPDLDIQRGAYIVEAQGFQNYDDKVMRLNALTKWLTMCLSNPMIAAEVKIRPILEQIAKAMGIDPDDALKSLAEKEAEQAKQLEDEQLQAENEMLMEEQKNALKAGTEAASAEANHQRQMEIEQARQIPPVPQVPAMATPV